MKYMKSLVMPSIITSCAGTGSGYDPIVDTVKDGTYQQTLTYCQKLSEQKSYVNGDTKTSTIGGGTQALQTKGDKKYIIVQCLRGYGYNVIL